MKGNDTLAKIYLLKFFFDGLFFLKKLTNYEYDIFCGYL